LGHFLLGLFVRSVRDRITLLPEMSLGENRPTVLQMRPSLAADSTKSILRSCVGLGFFENAHISVELPFVSHAPHPAEFRVKVNLSCAFS
jgi:hypothetical protein